MSETPILAPVVENISDAAAEAFSDALNKQIETCQRMVCEREGEGDYPTFFSETPDNTFLRVYGVEGERYHAVFAVVMGFVPGEPTFQTFIGWPQLREGRFEDTTADL